MVFRENLIFRAHFLLSSRVTGIGPCVTHGATKTPFNGRTTMIHFAIRKQALPGASTRSFLRALLLLSVGAGLLLAGCSSAWDDRNAAFKKGRQRCPRTNFRISCDYSPDNQLYRSR